jgi:hypothetical protein
MNITVESWLRVGWSTISVQKPSSKATPGVIIAFSDNGTSHMRENLLMSGLDWKKYARLHPQYP